MKIIVILSITALLVIAAALNNNTQAAESMRLTTDNGSIAIEVTMDKEMLEPEQPVRFTLKFLHPMTEQPLQHVNYALAVIDEEGSHLVHRTGIHNHEGVDIQSVTFPNIGSFTLTVDVEGLGINKPYDTRHSGMASTTLTVVPEFPLSVLAVMAAIVGIGVAITRFKNPLLRK